MFHKSIGIVLQTVKYGESSAIAKIYTEKMGLLSFMIYGYRSTKSSRKAAMLQPGTLLEIDFTFQANKSIHQIKELKRNYVYQSIPFDMRKSAVLLFLTELISKCVIEHHVSEEEFEFIHQKFIELDKAEQLNPLFHLDFLVMFTQQLGFFPEHNYSPEQKHFDIRNGVFSAAKLQDANSLSVDESRLLADILEHKSFEKQYPKSIRNSFAQKFLSYYAYHIDNFREIKSLKIFEDIFA